MGDRPYPLAKSAHKPQILDSNGRPIVMARTSHYAAERASVELAGWYPSYQSPDSEWLPEREIVLGRVHDLARNNGMISGAIQTQIDNWVGAGLHLAAKPNWRLLGVTDPDVQAEWEDLVEARFEEWGQHPDCLCDASMALTFGGMVAQACRMQLANFEITATAEWIARPGWHYRTAIQMVDPMRLSNPDNLPDYGPLRGGILHDERGAAIAYYFASRLQNDLMEAQRDAGVITWRRVPRFTPWGRLNVIHIFDRERPGQTRGKGGLVSVIARGRMLDKNERAHLQAAVQNAVFATAVISPMDWKAIGEALGAGADSDAIKQYLQDRLEFHKDSFIRFGDTRIPHLYPGEEIKHISPSHPHANFESFERVFWRYMAAGMNMTYEQFSRDYCVAPETRVLRADLQWVRADELTVGAEIVAFDEEAPGGKGNRRKWRKAKVERTGRRNLNRKRIVTDQGVVTVSDEHMFLCTSRYPSGAERGQGMKARSENPNVARTYGMHWVRADRLRPGDQIVFLCAPWSAGNTHLHGYLKGMADGEGWMNSYAEISIAQNKGAVLDEIGEALAALGFKAQLRAANGNGRAFKWSISGIGQCLRFLGEVRPTRLLKHADQVYEGRMVAGGAKESGAPTAATVAAVEDIGQGPVITLGTSTKTLITEGLCSHNSMTNYSGHRAALLDYWRFVTGRRSQIAGRFGSLVYALWLEEAMDKGIVPTPAGAPSFWEAKAAWTSCEWIGPGQGQIDPLKEANADLVEDQGGWTTDEILCARRGRDWRNVYIQRAKEAQFRKKVAAQYGVDPSEIKSAGPTRSPTPPDAPEPPRQTQPQPDTQEQVA